MKVKKRVLYYDILNITACLSVIFLHCNGIAHTYSDSLGWYQALLVEVLCYWAVPIFFMLSGATLLGYRAKYDTETFLKKRLFRTVIPFVVWSILVLLFKQATGQIDFLLWGKREFIDKFFNTSIENVYWFFIPLFSVYLSMPILSHLTEEKHRKTLWYIAFITFFLQSFCPTVFSILNLKYNYALNVPVVGGYLLYVILGYLLSTEDLTRCKRIILYLLGLFGAVLRYTATVYLSARDGKINKMFFSYTAFYALFLAVGVFVLFKYIPWNKIFKSEKSCEIISKISSCSFGIYLIHISVMFIMKTYLHISANCWQWRLLMPFVIYAVCALITIIIKKIPVIKNIVP